MTPLLLSALAAAATVTPSADELRTEWRRYVRDFVQDDGRVIDRGRDDLSTSEGQAYALVRAVWCDDRPAFDLVLRWTRDNLQGGRGEALPAWKWGKRKDGTWGVLDPQPASDADQWMAWALLLAADRWKEPAYRTQGLAIAGAVWTEETTELGGRRVLLPGAWAAWNEPVQLNPSYWLPFAWRRFAAEDPAHDWKGLVDTGYTFFETCRGATGLPVDWCWVDREGKVVPPPAGREESTDFGYEAFRVGWTLAAEVSWHGEARARALLGPLAQLADGWAPERPVPARIDATGRPREPWGYAGLVGALLPGWALERPGQAQAIWLQEVRSVRDAPGGGAKERDYYAHNWVWFGLALWSGLATP